MENFYISGIKGRYGLAEGALSPWSLPFLPNLLRPNLLRPECNPIIVQKSGAAKVEILHLNTAPVYQTILAVSSWDFINHVPELGPFIFSETCGKCRFAS